MLDFKTLERYNCTSTSLKNTSYDEVNDAYLTDLETLVYDFDKIKDSYLKDIRDRHSYFPSFRSNDALYNKNGKLIFIEFKNGCITSGKEKAEIRSKISESLLILTDILDAKLKEIRDVCYYVLVYNKDKNGSFEEERNKAITKISTTFGNFAGNNFLIAGFDRYRVFFQDVHTINQDELKGLLEKL